MKQNLARILEYCQKAARTPSTKRELTIYRKEFTIEEAVNGTFQYTRVNGLPDWYLKELSFALCTDKSLDYSLFLKSQSIKLLKSLVPSERTVDASTASNILSLIPKYTKSTGIYHSLVLQWFSSYIDLVFSGLSETDESHFPYLLLNVLLLGSLNKRRTMKHAAYLIERTVLFLSQRESNLRRKLQPYSVIVHGISRQRGRSKAERELIRRVAVALDRPDSGPSPDAFGYYNIKSLMGNFAGSAAVPGGAPARFREDLFRDFVDACLGTAFLSFERAIGRSGGALEDPNRLTLLIILYAGISKEQLNRFEDWVSKRISCEEEERRGSLKALMGLIGEMFLVSNSGKEISKSLKNGVSLLIGRLISKGRHSVLFKNLYPLQFVKGLYIEPKLMANAVLMANKASLQRLHRFLVHQNGYIEVGNKIIIIMAIRGELHPSTLWMHIEAMEEDELRTDPEGRLIVLYAYVKYRTPLGSKARTKMERILDGFECYDAYLGGTSKFLDFN